MGGVLNGNSKTVVGYLGIIIPKYNFFQGAFLYQELRGLGQEMISQIKRIVPDNRTAARAASSASVVSILSDTKSFHTADGIEDHGKTVVGEQMIEDVKRSVSKSPLIVRKFAEGVAAEDQDYLGALSAGLIEGARTENHALMASASWALSILSDSKFFCVEGEIDDRGTSTQFWRMPPIINSADAARAYVHNLPEVLKIKDGLLDEAFIKATTKEN